MARPKVQTQASRAWPWPVQLVLDLANGQHDRSGDLVTAAWISEISLIVLIIRNIAYTEIDWVAYMEQIAQFVDGERDYTKIQGQTGPLVYPAFHVYIFTGLYYVTDHGKNIFLVQHIFGALQLATLGLVFLCYWKAKVPPWVFPVLMLSKRLHSIFVLRCFNDCFAAFFLWVTIFFFQRRYWTFGAVAYTLGLGVKMSLLLTLPAVVIILFMGRGFKGALKLVWLMAQVQFAIAVPFLTKNPWGYLGRAFELSRQFKYEWTVNWRMIPEDIFLSRAFALTLLAGHGTLLMLFIINRWLQPTDRSLFDMIPSLLQLKSPFTFQQEAVISSRLTPDFVMHTMLSANVLGLLFARSLHYQFYAYLAWATPYLIYRASPRPSTVWGFFVLQEYAWNVFPSTHLSSAITVLTLAMAVWSAYSTPPKENRQVQPPVEAEPALGRK